MADVKKAVVLDGLITEQSLARVELDTLSIAELVQLMNEQDAQVHEAVRHELPHIERAVQAIAAAFKRGGRLLYVGAGTSGRLAALDAFECPLTFGVGPHVVQAVVAREADVSGDTLGDDEDSAEAGVLDLSARAPNAHDVVVGISASGRTPYVVGALQHAAAVGATTVAVVCNPDCTMADIASIVIAPVVGPEVLMGSTRLKAGTAQKMVLNMLTTASMVQHGRVYKNLMVDMRLDNDKLRARALRIVQLATGCDVAAAERALEAASGRTKTAILTLLTGCDATEADRLLEKADAIRPALQMYNDTRSR